MTGLIGRCVKVFFSGQLMRELFSLIRLRRRKHSLIVFYCSSWSDEPYIRSAALASVHKGLNVALIVSGAFDAGPFSEKALVPYRLSARLLKYTGAKIVVSASTGLGLKCLPRQVADVVHMPHSLVSFNLAYDPKAFDAFTRFFVCGEYQAAEIHELDCLAGRTPRAAEIVGYGKTDLIDPIKVNKITENDLILIAPSWGENAFLETVGQRVIEALLEANWRVCLRPHPRYLKHSTGQLALIDSIFSKHQNFTIENPLQMSSALYKASLVISDYSGAAFEYVLSKRRPAVFIDLPSKRNNPKFDLCKNSPVEITWRQQVGIVVPPSPSEILAAVKSLSSGYHGKVAAIERLRSELLIDGKCGVRVANLLTSMVSQQRKINSVR